MDPYPGYFIKIYCLIFIAYFYAKTCLPIQKLGNIYILSFFNSSDLGFEIKKFLFAVFG